MLHNCYLSSCAKSGFSQMLQLLGTDHHHTAAGVLQDWATVQNNTT